MKKILFFLLLIMAVLITGGNPVFAAAPSINDPSTTPSSENGVVYFVDEENETFEIIFSARSNSTPFDFIDPTDFEINQGLAGIPLVFSLEPDNDNICVAPNCDLQELIDYGIESLSYTQLSQTFIEPFYIDGYWTLGFDAEKTAELIGETSELLPLMFDLTFYNRDGSTSETFEYVLTQLYRPVIEGINPASGTIEVDEDDTFEFTIIAYDADADLSSVELYIGFNFNDNQILSICADAGDVYCGDEQAFIDYGVSVEYITYNPLIDPETRHEWTLTFDQERVAAFVEGTQEEPQIDLTFQVIAKDDSGLSFGMGRDYQFNYVEAEEEPQEGAGASSGSSSTRSGGLVYGCSDERALNYNRFSAHRQSLCEYDAEVIATGTPLSTFEGGSCLLTQNMKRGDRDGFYSTYQQGVISQVAALQQYLEIDSDGIFGPITQQAVRSFQNAHNLSPDGVVGPLTLIALNSNCNS